MLQAYTNTLNLCRQACEQTAEACFIAASTCRTSRAHLLCLAALDDCRAACDRNITALNAGNLTDCSTCAAFCHALSAKLDGIGEADFIWARDAARQCAGACLSLAASENLGEGWNANQTAGSARAYRG